MMVLQLKRLVKETKAWLSGYGREVKGLTVGGYGEGEAEANVDVMGSVVGDENSNWKQTNLPFEVPKKKKVLA